MKSVVYFNEKRVDLEYDIVGPGIYVYKNAIPKDWDLVNRVESALAKENTRFSWQQAGVGYGSLVSDYRACKDFKINEITLGERDEFSEDLLDLHKEIMDSLKSCLEHYKPENFLAAVDHFEAINIVRYGKGEFFKTHTDDGDPYRCTVSAVGYPNDDYEGGELLFVKFGIKYKPEAGDLVIFPSAYSYAHSSEPVTDDGVKYSLVIMMDRNSFAHRKDSPTFYPEHFREQFNVYKV
jgi:hypothetical protein